MNAACPHTPLKATDGVSRPPTELDASCRWPLLALVGGAAVWLTVWSVLALVASIKFHDPGFLADLPWLTYGRVRPAAWNALLYGGVLPLGLGVGLWMLCRLGGAKLEHPILALAGGQLWHLGVLVGLLGILAGQSTGFEWLEMPRPAAVLLFLGYMLIGVAALATTSGRAVRELHPAQWFYLAALYWFPWIYSTAHLLLIVWPARGVVQAVIAWWYAANLLVVWLGLVGLAIVFYIVPKLLERPLASRGLALVTFWGLLLAGSWQGIPAGAPVPAWLPTLSTAAAGLMLVPLLASVLNCVHTARGRLGAGWSHPTLRFVALGFSAYVISELMHGAETLPITGRLLQFTWFVPARHQLALYGFLVLGATGAVYEILPRLTGLPWCGRRAGAHFWMATAGLLLVVGPLAAGGIRQGLQLTQAEVPFSAVTQATLWTLRLSTVGEVLVLLANLIFLRNLLGALWRLGGAQLEALRAAAIAPVRLPEAAP